MNQKTRPCESTQLRDGTFHCRRCEVNWDTRPEKPDCKTPETVIRENIAKLLELLNDKKRSAFDAPNSHLRR